MKVKFQLHRPQFLKSSAAPNAKQEADRDEISDGDPGSTRLEGNEGNAAAKAKDRSNRKRILGSPMLTFSVGDDKVESFKGFANELRKSQSSEPGALSFKALAGGHLNEELGDYLVKGTYQLEKEALFAAANSGLGVMRKVKLATAMECMNSIHNKEGHNKNTVATTKLFLADPGIGSAIVEARIATGQKRSFSPQDMANAAQWHGLADRDIPVAVLAAQRRLTPAEMATYIEPRSAKSAKIFDDLHLGRKKTSELIRQTRVFGSESKSRPVEAQLLDVLDRLAGMGAKKFFQEHGKVNVGKLFDTLDAGLNNDKVHVDPVLLSAVRRGVEAELLDKALGIHRQVDGYVK